MARKDRKSQNSQGSSNNALLEVIAQLKHQNQELLDLLATQQSAKGIVKTSACRTRAVKINGVVDSTAEHSAVKRMKNKESVRYTSTKVIIQDGWSDPVVQSFEEFRLANTGVCLVTRSEAEEAIHELRSGKGLAIQEVELEVKTAQSQPSMWKRILGTTGHLSRHVELLSATRVCGGRHCTSCGRLFPQHCHPDAWKTALTRPKSATAHWLKKLGEFGVFSRSFYVKGESRVYKNVTKPDGFDFQTALRKAKAVGSSILGVVLGSEGLGLRTRECGFESVVGQIYTAEDARRFIGKNGR